MAGVGSEPVWFGGGAPPSQGLTPCADARYPRPSRRQTVASGQLSEGVNMAVLVITVPRTTMRADPGDEARLLQEELNDNGPHMGRLVQLLPAVGEEDWLLAVFDVEDRSPETRS